METESKGTESSAWIYIEGKLDDNLLRVLQELKQMELYGLGNARIVSYRMRDLLSSGVGSFSVKEAIKAIDGIIQNEKRRKEIEISLKDLIPTEIYSTERNNRKSNYSNNMNNFLGRLTSIAAKNKELRGIEGEYQRLLNVPYYRFVIGLEDPTRLLSKEERDSRKGAYALIKGDITYLQRRRNLVEAGMDWDTATKEAELSGNEKY